MWRRSLHDVRVKRGADVHAGGDHQLVTAIIKLKLGSVNLRAQANESFDLEKFHDNKVKRDFTL